MLFQRKPSIPSVLPEDTFLINSTSTGVKPHTYVDKTSIIYRLIQRRGVYCLCRPRRFGKTLTASIIADIFSNGIANYSDCAIAQANLWNDSTYSVLFISFYNVYSQTIDGFDKAFENLLRTSAHNAGITLDHSSNVPSILLNNFLQQIQKQIVVIIDEYDLPLISSISNNELYAHISQALASFYSIFKMHENKIRFMLLTGVNRISNLSIFSGINNIKDISLEPQYASIVGYTEQELVDNFAEPLSKIAKYYELNFNEFMQQLKIKYNGYCFDLDLQTTVFNTWDINNLLTSTISSFNEKHFLPSYWAKTGSLSNFVLQYFAHNKQGLLNFIEQATTSLPQIDIDEILAPKNFKETSEHIFMLNAGYLTLAQTNMTEFSEYQLAFPNQAVMNLVLDDLVDAVNSFLNDKGQSLVDKNQDVFSLLDVTLSAEQYKRTLSSMIISSGVLLNDSFLNEDQLRTLLIVMFKAAKIKVQFEVAKIGGRVDLLIVHKNTAYIFELKVFDSSKLKKEQPSPSEINEASAKKKLEAFRQIAKKEYHYVIPPECTECYFGAVVGDRASSKITDFEYLPASELTEYLNQHQT